MSEFGLVIEILNEIKELLAVQNKQRFAEQYITTEELAEILQVSRRTIQTMRDNRVLPYAQLNRRVYFRLTDVEQLLENAMTSAQRKKFSRKVRSPRKRGLKKGSWTLRTG